MKTYEVLALEAIKKGGKFNGKFYGKFIYVSNKKYQIDDRDAFLITLKNQTGYAENFRMHGFDYAEEGNSNVSSVHDIDIAPAESNN